MARYLRRVACVVVVCMLLFASHHLLLVDWGRLRVNSPSCEKDGTGILCPAPVAPARVDALRTMDESRRDSQTSRAARSSSNRVGTRDVTLPDDHTGDAPITPQDDIPSGDHSQLLSSVDVGRFSPLRTSLWTSVRDVRVPSSARYACEGSWRLPVGMTRFCRAYDGDMLLKQSSLDLRRTVSFPPATQALVCDPESPLAIRKCNDDECGGARGCIMSVPSIHCPQPVVVIPYRTASFAGITASTYESFATLLLPVPRNEMDSATVSTLIDPSSRENEGDERTSYRYPTTVALEYAGFPVETIQRCADFAMRSFCNRAFQLLPTDDTCLSNLSTSTTNTPLECLDKRRMVKCVVYRYPYRVTGRVRPSPNQPLFHFMHRAEWRPSLLRDDLRIVIVNAPERVFLLDESGAASPLIKVGLRRRVGELVPLGLRATIRMRFLVTRCAHLETSTSASVSSQRPPLLLDERRVAWASPAAANDSSPSSASFTPSGRGDIELVWGFANLSMWVGCSVAFDVTASVESVSDRTTLRRRVVSVILWEAERVVLHREGSHDVVDRECAPLLRHDECCLSGLSARHATTLGSYAASGRKWEGKLVEIAGRPHECLSIVDGSVGSFEYHGEASFPHLVIRNQCTNPSSPVNQTAHYWDLLLLANERQVLSSLSLDVTSILRSCGGRSHSAPAGEGRVSSHHSLTLSTTRDADPVLFSVCVHQSPKAIARLLRNLHSMAAPSVVVLHVAASWNISLDVIRALNGSAHPMVFINDLRNDYSYHKSTLLQLYNARYMATKHPHIRWSHVVLIASNEALTKAGIVPFVKQYDMSTGNRPADGPALAIRHSFLGGRPDVRLVDTENFDHPFAFWEEDGFWGHGLRGNFALMRLMRILGFQTLSIVQRYTEGSYFRRDIAVLFAELLHTFFESPGDCVDWWTAHGESYVYNILQRACVATSSTLAAKETPSETYARYFAVLERVSDDEVPPGFNRNATATLMSLVEHARCGERTGTVMWQNEEWRVRVEDIRASRCSPFSTPFSLKRVKREANNDVWQHLKLIESDPQRVQLLRETSPAYCRTKTKRLPALRRSPK